MVREQRLKGRKWRIAVMSMAVVGLTLLGGCQSKGKATAPGPAPAYNTLAETQNSRVAQLNRVYADGVIEIRWRDNKGKHFEQGSMELWLQQPSSTALRVEKLGEVLLWVGSNDQHYWFFDMLGDETVLRTGSHDEPVSTGVSSAFSIRPLVLLDLMGFVTMPIGQPNEPPVQFDPQSRTWTAEMDGRGGPLRLHFDPATLTLVRIEALAKHGEPSLVSTLSRFESVFQRGVSPASFPKMAQAIKIVSQVKDDEDQLQSGEVSLFINEATGEIDAAELARVFDLDRLIRGMNPDRIERSEASRRTAAGEPR